MRVLCLAATLFLLPLHATEYPFWDGHESVDSYAKRVNLPPAKSFDLGNGVTLDLVLIPAGEFLMGSPEPAEPTVSYNSAYAMICMGALTVLFLLEELVRCWARQQPLRFSLGWLISMTAAGGIFVGGIARAHLARQQEQKYDAALAIYNALPKNEKPARLTAIAAPFYMSKYTLTEAQYGALMNDKSSAVKHPQLPISSFDWESANTFLKRLGETQKDHLDKGMMFEFPTEAQWEFACRAGTTTPYYTGETIGSEQANFDASPASGSSQLTFGIKGTLKPAGSYAPNPFGLYDMHGNISQLCLTPENRDAPVTGRGGSWFSEAKDCRSAARFTLGGLEKIAPIANDGLRVILTLPRENP